MRRVALRFLAVAALLIALGTATAPAAAQSTTLAVSAVVVNTCTVAALPLVFAYDPADANLTTAQTTLTITCLDPYEVAIDACTHGGSTATRQMDLAGSKINYALKCTTENDSECLSNWGNAQGTDTLTGTTGAAVMVTVDGEMTAGQTATTGTYTDTCTVTLQF